MTDDRSTVLVDAGIHHRWADDDEVLDYLDDNWRHYVGRKGMLAGGAGMRVWIPGRRYPNPAGDDLEATDLGPFASGAEALSERWLTPQKIDRALLLCGPGMFVAANPNPYLATALVRAINDWTIHRWLDQDARLYGAILVPSQVPDDAVAELRRVGEHPKVACVSVAGPMLGKTLGHPVYHPIYREAERLGLPIVVPRGGDGVVDLPTGPAAGPPMTFAEYEVGASNVLATQLTSLITNGVLDTYPSLKVYLAGSRVAWIPGFMLRFEMVARALRREVPWMRREITDYVAEQVRFGLHGLERGRGARVARDLVAQAPVLSRACFYASGYPSWDTTTPNEAEHVFPADAGPAIVGGNASGWFRWPATVSV